MAALPGVAAAENLWFPCVGAAAAVGQNDTMSSLRLLFPDMQDRRNLVYLDLRLDPEHMSDGTATLSDVGTGLNQVGVDFNRATFWVETMKPVWDKFAGDVGQEMIDAAQSFNSGG